MGDAARQLLGDAPRPFHDGVEVEADPVGLEPEVLRALHQVEYFGRSQQRLGGDAAPVQADAAKLGAFDHGDLQAQLRAADRADVAAWTGADHHHVEILRHRVSPVVRFVVIR